MSLFCDAPSPHSTPLMIRRQREAVRNGQQLVHILIRTTPAILPSPPAVSELMGDMAWWLLGGCLEKVRILHVRHSDQRAPQAIRRLGKKTRIMQLSENARSPPTSPLSGDSHGNHPCTQAQLNTDGIAGQLVKMSVKTWFLFFFSFTFYLQH